MRLGIEIGQLESSAAAPCRAGSVSRRARCAGPPPGRARRRPGRTPAGAAPRSAQNAATASSIGTPPTATSRSPGRMPARAAGEPSADRIDHEAASAPLDPQIGIARHQPPAVAERGAGDRMMIGEQQHRPLGEVEQGALVAHLRRPRRAAARSGEMLRPAAARDRHRPGRSAARSNARRRDSPRRSASARRARRRAQSERESKAADQLAIAPDPVRREPLVIRPAALGEARRLVRQSRRRPVGRAEAGAGLDRLVPVRRPGAVASRGGPAARRASPDRRRMPSAAQSAVSVASRIGEHVVGVDHRRRLPQPVRLALEELRLAVEPEILERRGLALAQIGGDHAAPDRGSGRRG